MTENDASNQNNDGAEGTPSSPRDAGVRAEQQRGTTPIIPEEVLEAEQGLNRGAFALGVWSAAEAFRSAADQALIAHWGGDLQRRLDRRETEQADLMQRLADERVERARADERLDTVRTREARDDLLKLGGGAAIAVGLEQIVAGHYIVGIVWTGIGVLVAYIGGARIPRPRI